MCGVRGVGWVVGWVICPVFLCPVQRGVGLTAGRGAVVPGPRYGLGFPGSLAALAVSRAANCAVG